MTDVPVHACGQIAEHRGEEPAIFVLLFCNSATVVHGIVDAGVRLLIEDPSPDGAVTVSPYNEYSPVRAKHLDDRGPLVPYVDVESIDGASRDRGSAATAYFCDCSAWAPRKRCTDRARGIRSSRWTGRRSAPQFQEGRLDVDHGYGLAQTGYWPRRRGFTETTTPYKDRARYAATERP